MDCNSSQYSAISELEVGHSDAHKRTICLNDNSVLLRKIQNRLLLLINVWMEYDLSLLMSYSHFLTQDLVWADLVNRGLDFRRFQKGLELFNTEVAHSNAPTAHRSASPLPEKERRTTTNLESFAPYIPSS